MKRKNMGRIWPHCASEWKKITIKSDNKSSLQPYHNCLWNCYWNCCNCSNLIWSKHWRNCSFTFLLDFRYMHPGLDWGKYQFLINSIHRHRTQNEEINLKCLGWMNVEDKYTCVSCWLFTHKSRDSCQAKTKENLVKSWVIHKMTSIFTQNDNFFKSVYFE